LTPRKQAVNLPAATPLSLDRAGDFMAAEIVEPHAHQPFVPHEASMPEMTLRAIVAGAVLGVLFGASSLYLVLKVGMTVSASIPIAVISVSLFRVIARVTGLSRTTILENNIVQTTGSAGESIAFGVGVTMPALLLLGFDMELWRVMLVAALGGTLGILMMIPLRRAFIVHLHGQPGEPGKLLYPEGTACAEVLITSEKGGAGGLFVFGGFLLAGLHKFVTDGLHLLKDAVTYPLTWYNKAAAVSTGMDAALLGVGYIIGSRTAAVMMAGSVMGYLVLAPAIYTFGSNLTEPLPPASSALIRDMSIPQIRSNYLLYIGAGCVASAGIISMFRTLPLIAGAVRSGFSTIGAGLQAASRLRTERDMSIGVTLVGSLGLVALLAMLLAREVPLATALMGGGLIVVFGFLFVLVSSRLTGEIGSSSNPISGMTIATLLITCFIFLARGMTSPMEQVLALTIGAVVCVAASNGGTTSQDLKTGFLVGATPIYQQYALLIGAISSALCIGLVLLAFNRAGTIYSAKNAPDVSIGTRVSELTQQETHDGKAYKILQVTQATEREWPGIQRGKYLVDDTGQIKFLIDPTITGRLREKDDGTPVSFKFEAPKTQVMALIVNGVLGGSMNWGLVLLGVMITIVLELCGLPALAFAVGMYISMSDTAPIFLGGLVRFGAELWTRPRRGAAPTDGASSIAEEESSPGVLLSSGYVAGATLAGAVLAFLNIPKLANGKTWIEALEAWAAGWGVGLAETQGPATIVFGGLMLLLLVTATRRMRISAA
jgi:putative OPT family oligopeptide transporter